GPIAVRGDHLMAAYHGDVVAGGQPGALHTEDGDAQFVKPLPSEALDHGLCGEWTGELLGGERLDPLLALGGVVVPFRVGVEPEAGLFRGDYFRRRGGLPDELEPTARAGGEGGLEGGDVERTGGGQRGRGRHGPTPPAGALPVLRGEVDAAL